MNPATRRLIAVWMVGAAAGTAIVAVTSPLFVRSYLPLRPDPLRGVWTLPENTVYRWRSEGYANTAIGPFGMPGKTSIGQRSDHVVRVALWGDSQAEGVCVDDAEKLFAMADMISDGRLEVFPLTRSGEDAADWVTQIPPVEQELQIDVHVILTVDLSDLLAAIDAPVAPPSDADVAQARSAIAARVPAFVVQSARNLLREVDESPRRLRFSVGPVTPQVGASATPTQMPPRVDWSDSMKAIRDSSELPIVILYAPKAPQIVSGYVMMDDPFSSQFDAMASAAESNGLLVTDTREALRDSVLQGRWPHGFQNGFIGAGHLNADGNTVVASQMVDAVLRVADSVARGQ